MTTTPQEARALASNMQARGYEYEAKMFDEFADLLERQVQLQTPNATLPPLGGDPRRNITVTVSAPANWESRLDMQWVLEREIHADRWSWTWPETEPNMRHPKIQALIGSNARKNIEMSLVEELLDEGPELDLSSMDMEYWNSTHDKLREALLRAETLTKALEQARKALEFYANGDNQRRLTGFKNGVRINWLDATRELKDAGFVMCHENYDGTEDYIEDGSRAQAALKVIDAALE